MARKHSAPTTSIPARRPHEAWQSASALPLEELRVRLGSLRPRDTDVHAAAPLANYLTFWIAGEHYALPLARAREIVRCESVTKVPDTPAWLRGVTNIRGTVIPVIDLAPRLGSAETAAGQRTAILLIEVDWTGEHMVLGLLIEAVGQVAAVAPEAIGATPPFGTRINTRLLVGLMPVDGRFALILDIDAVLSAKELLPSLGAAEGGAVLSRSAIA
jgi:purine-binding chemotaxis protein CheW